MLFFELTLSQALSASQSKVKSHKDITRRLKALEAMSVDHFILPTLLLVSIFFFFWLLLKDIWPFNPKRLIVVFTAQEVFLDWGALNHCSAQCYIKWLKVVQWGSTCTLLCRQSSHSSVLWTILYIEG